jgi:hypothetical protein
VPKFPVLATIAALSLALPGAAIANETIAHLKGNLAVAAPKAKTTAAPGRAACHPDPSKGRDCRHRAAQADAKAAALAQNATAPDAGTLAANERAR